MRRPCRSFLAAIAAVTVFASGALFAEDDDDAAADAKLRKEALDKAVARGKDLFRAKELGRKTCASCHENADKPNLNLATRQFCYPAYSPKAKAVVSMGQKINEMITTKSGGKALDLAGTDVAAIEAYVVSLKTK
jgi:cytochrome c